MKRSIIASIVGVAAALALAACNSGDKHASTAVEPAPLTYENSASVVTTARVERLDQNSRWITLRYPSGATNTFMVGPQVKRLDDVRVGDTVKATYTVTLEGELRPPTSEEAANPSVVTRTATRAPEGSDPSRGVQRQMRVVTTVEAVDLGRMRVTLKGPSGETMDVRARKPDNIKKLRVGDTIVVTYTESAVISLDRA